VLLNFCRDVRLLNYEGVEVDLSQKVIKYFLGSIIRPLAPLPAVYEYFYSLVNGYNYFVQCNVMVFYIWGIFIIYI